MAASSERIVYLLNQVTSQTATAAEQQELNNWIAETGDDGTFQQYVQALLEKYAHEKAPDVQWEWIFSEIQAKKTLPDQEPVASLRFLKTNWIKYAAAVIIVIGAAAYLWNQNVKIKTESIKIDVAKTDIGPGGERATLTLADGRTIVLDTTTDGTVAVESNAEVIKLANGEIGYRTLNNSPETDITYNIMSTPKGGQYKVRLSDGTRVWLNAASSIRYPSAFRGNERKVEITGEAYFEVAPDKQKPFTVLVDSKTEIQVLGTRFNINAYADDQSVYTTLLEGSVKVQYASLSQILEPGQQASVNTNNRIEVTNGADIDEVMAWKNGNFYFNDIDLRSAMNQLDRWYDVDVIFKDNLENEKIRAIIPRNIPISKLIHKLSLTGKINYNIQGRTIYITK